MTSSERLATNHLSYGMAHCNTVTGQLGQILGRIMIYVRKEKGTEQVLIGINDTKVISRVCPILHFQTHGSACSHTWSIPNCT
jgi:hypothetical protein